MIGVAHIDFDDLEFEVHYDLTPYKAQTYSQPAEGEVNILKVLYKDEYVPMQLCEDLNMIEVFQEEIVNN